MLLGHKTDLVFGKSEIFEDIQSVKLGSFWIKKAQQTRIVTIVIISRKFFEFTFIRIAWNEIWLESVELEPVGVIRRIV